MKDKRKDGRGWGRRRKDGRMVERKEGKKEGQMAE
jgi:hypothetical protein